LLTRSFGLCQAEEAQSAFLRRYSLELQPGVPFLDHLNPPARAGKQKQEGIGKKGEKLEAENIRRFSFGRIALHVILSEAKDLQYGLSARETMTLLST
jgi:hypothetical protein